MKIHSPAEQTPKGGRQQATPRVSVSKKNCIKTPAAQTPPRKV